MTFRKPIVGAAALGMAMLGAGLAAPPARAAYIVTLAQVGSNVVATGSGTIDTAGLSFLGRAEFGGGFVVPSIGTIVTGPAVSSFDVYSGFTGPASFGSGGETVASSGSGDLVGILASPGELDVPLGYVSGSALSDSATYDNQTFGSLGVTPGTYVYTSGSGANADSFTVQIGAAPVPEPMSLALLGSGLLGLCLVARRRRA